jgi:hypothetical protein
MVSASAIGARRTSRAKRRETIEVFLIEFK